MTQRNAEHGRDDDGGQQEFTRLPQHAGAIREDEGAKDIAWRLLWQPQQRGKQNLFRLTTQHFEYRCAFDALFLEDFPEHWRFKNPSRIHRPNGDHYDADKEGDAPPPDQELVSRQPTENKDRRVRQEEPGGGAKLWPGGDEAAMLAGPCPFHREQHRTAPFPADPNALDQTDECQQNGAPDADAGITWHQVQRQWSRSRLSAGCDQRRLAADPIPEMAEDRGPDWPPDKPDEEHAKRLEHAN